jgi:hypothetical protein
MVNRKPPKKLWNIQQDKAPHLINTIDSEQSSFATATIHSGPYFSCSRRINYL